jgi:hypothetical protein
LYGPNARQNAEQRLEGRARTARLGELARTVSEWFDLPQNEIVGAASVRATNTIFYRNYGAGTVLHESLHLLTQKDDVDLADQLGGAHDGTRDSASRAVNAALKANGCKF